MSAQCPRIVLVNSYVRENAGDAALLSVCLDQVLRAKPGADLVIAGFESPADHPHFEGVPNIGSAQRFVADPAVGRPRRALRRIVFALWFLPYLLLPGPLRRIAVRHLSGESGAELRAISGADAVVSIGGGYLQAPPGLNGWQQLGLVLAPLVAGLREGLPVVLMPQSFGPFPARGQRRLVRWVLSRCALVCAREEISMRVLEDCGLAPDQIVLAHDSGFVLGRRRTSGHAPPGEQLRIGVTTRAWLPPDQQQAFERSVARVVDRLIERGHEVTLIPHVTNPPMNDDDRVSNGRVARLCRRNPILLGGIADYRDLLKEYGALDLLIGTRFHSVIFSLIRQTPCVAIAYEHKTHGIMQLLGFERWVIDMEQVASGGDLEGLVEDAVAQLSAYGATLAATMPLVAEWADTATDMVRTALRAGRS